MLSVIQTLRGQILPPVQEVMRFALSWRDAGQPVLSIINSSDWTSSTLVLPDSRQITAADITQAFYNRNRGTTAFEENRPPSLAIDGLVPAPSGVIASAAGSSTTLWFDRSGFIGLSASAHRSGDLLFLSRWSGGGIETWDMSGPQPRLRATLSNTPSLGLEAVSAMTSLDTPQGLLLIAASQIQHSLTVLRLGSGGVLHPLAVIGTTQMLPIAAPSALFATSLGGQNFVILGAAALSSLTVMRLGADGSLTLTDQVIDNQLTRFAGVSAMDVLSHEGRILIAAAGKDGGVTLLQLLPNGRLVTLFTLEDTVETALQTVIDLQFVVAAGRIELFALAAGDHGVTRLLVGTDRLAPGRGGIVATATEGTSGDDILTFPRAGGWVRAGAGDDILIAGNGIDTLEGGPGRDLFILSPDAEGRDQIRDFTPGEDLIDMSAFPLLRRFESLTVIPSRNGATIRFGATDITVLAGRTLTAEDLRPAILFNNDRILPTGPLPASVPPTPPPGNVPLVWVSGAQRYQGNGNDSHLSYHPAPSGITLDLAGQSRNAGAAAGHLLTAIPVITGTRFNDHISGDAVANTLQGGAGNDLLEGRGGNDWLVPGPGNDTVDGGEGVDMVSYANSASGVTVNLATGVATATGKRDQLRAIETVTGSSHDDAITGDAGDNLLRGLGGNDWFNASAGNDTYEGGPGRDMVSYIAAQGRVEVDLGQGRGLVGMARGDVYLSIERITGTSWGDLFIGGPDNDEFRGMGDYDWFVGSGGSDTFDGGGGRDTVAYASAPGGVTANLQTGRGTTGQAAGDVYIAVENLTGSSHADRLTGDDEANILRALGGDDILFGLGGNDTLDGGTGNDLIYGGSGNDRIFSSPGHDTIHGDAGWDTVVYSGKRADYTLIPRPGGATQVSHATDGRDLLYGIEVLEFSDGRIWL